MLTGVLKVIVNNSFRKVLTPLLREIEKAIKTLFFFFSHKNF